MQKRWLFKPSKKIMSKKFTGNNYKAIIINGKQIRLHCYVMECYLGRELTKDEVVHHINGIITDNRIENLQVISRADHVKIHHSEMKKKNFTAKTHHHLTKEVVIGGLRTKTMLELSKELGVSHATIYRRKRYYQFHDFYEFQP